ncbi:MAG TPA: VCBS repeat-containing protein, partial [Myxococcota bacterium]|nr:VCBS repeat-containing protein [Myxococcota bacterium]
MRKAELDNCLTDQTGHACLIPFDPQGEHQLTTGMTEAARIWTDILLEDDPTGVVPRYMLNLCHMALGDWPEAVEPQWRMDPALLAPEELMPQWHNVAPAVGLAEPMLAGNTAMEDVDGDGLLDLLTSSAELDVGMRLYLSNGDGTFCEATAPSGLGDAVGGLDFWPADYDNDGDVDLLLTRGAWMNEAGQARPSLMRNDGQGHFVDVAVEAGLAEVVGPSQGAAWADV